MPYLSSAALFRPTYKINPVDGLRLPNPPQGLGYTVFAPNAVDPRYAASGGAGDTIASPTPGGLSSGYPGYTRHTGDWTAFAVGDYVRVTAAAADGNGSTLAPKVWRVAYIEGTFLGVEGTGSSAITTVATATYTIRKVRLWRVADLRSIQGAAHPVTLQATSATLLANTALHASLDDGVTWTALPGVILPDTANANANVVQFFVGYEVLLMVVPGDGTYAGTIYAG